MRRRGDGFHAVPADACAPDAPQRLTRDYLLSLLAAGALALVGGAVIMLVCGHNPAEGYAALVEGALGKPRAVGNTLAKAETLCLTGLAMSLAA